MVLEECQWITAVNSYISSWRGKLTCQPNHTIIHPVVAETFHLKPLMRTSWWRWRSSQWIITAISLDRQALWQCASYEPINHHSNPSHGRLFESFPVTLSAQTFCGIGQNLNIIYGWIRVHRPYKQVLQDNGSVPFKCPTKTWQCHSETAGPWNS